jgi:hypothetical protein
MGRGRLCFSQSEICISVLYFTKSIPKYCPHLFEIHTVIVSYVLYSSTRTQLPSTSPDHYTITHYDEGAKTVLSSVMIKPAILALVNVLRTPENSAETATRDTSPDRDGAI